MPFDDDAAPEKEKNTMTRRNVLKALGTGIIASGVTGIATGKETVLTSKDELTP